MSSPARTSPVKDTIPKIGNELAIGEDLEFQRRWWRFEHIVWAIFGIILALDLAGVMGRGPAAKAHAHTGDGAMNLTYERFERFQTPSILAIHFGSNAVHDGKIQLWVSQSLIKGLGSQRIIPQPVSSVLFDQGVLYTWDANQNPDSAEFALQPSEPGIGQFTLRLPALGDEITRRVYIWP